MTSVNKSLLAQICIQTPMRMQELRGRQDPNWAKKKKPKTKQTESHHLCYSFQDKTLTYWKVYVYTVLYTTSFTKLRKILPLDIKSLSFFYKSWINITIIRTWVTYLGYRNGMKSLILQMLRNVRHRICHNHTSSVKHVFYCLKPMPKHNS